MPDATFVSGDDTPALEATIKSGGSAVDLTNADSVRFHMKQTGADSLTVDAAATITDAANGLVTYDWASGDLSSAGLYEAEFEIAWSDGTTQTWPSDVPLSIRIRDQLD